jgi:hypothetical protein
MHEIKAFIYLFLNEYEKCLEEFERVLQFFREEKQR